MKKDIDPNLKILVVEDSLQNEKDTKEYLIGLGFAPGNINSATNKIDAQKVLEKMPIDLALLDLRIPDRPDAQKKVLVENGLDLLRWTIHHNQATKVVVITHFPLPWVVFQVISLGVSMVEKDQGYTELPWAIKRTLEGNLVYTKGLDQIIRTAFKDAIRVYLDSKESEILKRINEDKMTNRKIGEEVYYTENTVKNTLRQLFNLTGIHDRSQLASWYAHYIAPICESD